MATFTEIEKEFHCIESTFEQVASYNENLIQPTLRPAERDTIYDGLDTMPVELYFQEKMRLPFKIKDLLKEILPPGIKSFLKRQLGF